MNILLRCLAPAMLCLSAAANADQQGQPPLNSNDWNIIFVQSFEPDPKTNNLSVKGFNHSLLFGQFLNTLTAGKSGDLRGVYAYTTSSSDMTPLESIEPFAVSNNRAVSTGVATTGPASTYGAASYYISDILNNQPRGAYVVAMPAALINDAVPALAGKASGYQGVTAGDYSQYVVLTVGNSGTTATVHNDGLTASDRYPDLHLTPTANYACPGAAAEIFVPRPNSSKFTLNTSQTVYFIRHVEAHPNASFENGNYVCQGQWRAIGAIPMLKKITGGGVANIFTTNSGGLINCSNRNCSYVRPALTIAPYAIQHGQPLKLAEFQWNDPASLAASLFTGNSPYSDAAFDKSTTLVAWEHGNIEAAVRYLIAVLYQNPDAAKALPGWSYTDYDTVWKVEIDKDGGLTFKTTCEGLSSNSLPAACPAFPAYGQ